ncbi:winged helix-turn-helix transcriptional regulator [Nitriliruptor alkaliphilus]|uniref:winged helix-turn-helix transcriptional regulator n=1 Tax=Nitriliruptor alkaliphilus TaxID=427918 RepID=UPI000695D665|nr:helix-turn-helix domain-containing protein [Nitriliruptor alkaliphilus]
MPAKDLTENCTVARTLEIVGDRWTVLVLRDAFYGVRRFDDFVADLGIARNILTDRLGRLVEHGVLVKRPYEDRPPRYEYRLTEKGRDLLQVVLALAAWGDRWTLRDDDPPVRFEHRPCGHDADPTLVCGHCREDLAWGSIRVDPTPVQVPDRRSGQPAAGGASSRA